MDKTTLQEKLREGLQAVLPIMAIVLVLSLTVAPVPTNVLLAFLLGGVFVIVGMMLFSSGAEMAMGPIGERIGARLTKSRNVALMLVVAFLLGLMITMSEPDLQVLATQVEETIPRMVLIVSVAVGVGLFLVVALLRMLFQVSLKKLLIFLYLGVLVLSFIVPRSFLAVAYDSGGVTTGPMTVPFIMAFGVGISSFRSDENASEDSFGLISLCSVGPILAVLLLCLIYHPQSAAFSMPVTPTVTESVQMGALFTEALPDYLSEIGIAILPIVGFFALFQLVALHLEKKTLSRILVGIAYTYVGLVLFLTGVNVGFMPCGTYLGGVLASLRYRQVIIPIGMLIGYFIVKAEPAVYVLEKQVEELTQGAIGGKALQRSLSYGVAASVGLALIRVLTGISILYLVVPGYLLAILLSFFVPNIFTAIAFDSGGVASGPMTATFLLPFAEGACIALGGNVVTDAFGVVAMVAMTPLISIQCLGLMYQYKSKRKTVGARSTDPFAYLDDKAIIEL